VTIITKETPRRAGQEDIPYYPIEAEHNLKLYQQYKELASCEQGVVFGGRLAEYKYMDMHVVIESAMNKWKNCQKQLLL
jgi:UDP-galactopyranose mutase